MDQKHRKTLVEPEGGRRAWVQFFISIRSGRSEPQREKGHGRLNDEVKNLDVPTCT